MKDFNLNEATNEQIAEMLEAQSENRSLNPSDYTSKSLDELRKEQDNFKRWQAKRKHQPDVEALDKYWAKVNALKDKNQPIQTLADLSQSLKLEIGRPQRDKKPLPIEEKSAKRIFWDILQFLIEEENKNKPANQKREFKVTQANKSILNDLVLYLIQSNKSNFDLNKGIFFYGLPGRGKTLLMKTAKIFLSQLEKFGAKNEGIKLVVSCKKIVREVAETKTIKPIKKFTKHVYCFDDLGFEQSYRLFGNDIDVMREILVERYDNFTRYGLVTHATSNLTPQQITEKYGHRIGSRFAQMFNVIYLDGEDYRKK